MNLVNSQLLTVLCAKSSGKMRAKGIYFGRKTEGKLGKMKLRIHSDPVIVDWHNIHLFLVPF